MADDLMEGTKRKRTEEEIEHEEELMEMSYISLLNMCDDGHLSRSGTRSIFFKSSSTHDVRFVLYFIHAI